MSRSDFSPSPYKLPADVARHADALCEGLFGLNLPAPERAGLTAFTRAYPNIAYCLLCMMMKTPLKRNWQSVIEEMAIVSGAAAGSLMSADVECGEIVPGYFEGDCHPSLSEVIPGFIRSCVDSRAKYGRPVLYPLVSGEFLAPVEPTWRIYDRRAPKDLREIRRSVAS